MQESHLMAGVRRALVVAGAGFGVALLGAGVARAADPVQLRSRLGDWCLDGPNGGSTATMVNPAMGRSPSSGLSTPPARSKAWRSRGIA